ncbi:MAG: hypothetical protein ACP5PW_03135, partial [Candidatus Dormibacteria bacterium]
LVAEAEAASYGEAEEEEADKEERDDAESLWRIFRNSFANFRRGVPESPKAWRPRLTGVRYRPEALSSAQRSLGMGSGG